MGDSETVVAEAPAAETHAAAGFGDSASNPTQEAASTVAEPAAEAVSQANSAYALGYSNTGDGNAYAGDPNAMQPEAQTNSMEDSKQGTEAPSGLGSAATGSSQVNGGPVGAIANATGLENGNALGNTDGSADEKQLADGYAAMSAEEDRLWNIIRANSSDFTAWTSLIEETEKVAEDNILKIRRVYDAFLAEFPLCYGYWKKYADHEARLGSVDKVVEVYERAVQGVTYSVDMWLHYCIFAISTYGDPDTVRRSHLVNG